MRTSSTITTRMYKSMCAYGVRMCISIQMFSVGSGALARPSGRFGLFAAAAQKHAKTRDFEPPKPLERSNRLLSMLLEPRKHVFSRKNT